MALLDRGGGWIGLQHIRSKSVHAFGGSSEAPPRDIERSGRHAQHYELAAPSGQCVDERRLSAPPSTIAAPNVAAGPPMQFKYALERGGYQLTACADLVS
jgi:hypothetical protein